MCTTYFSTYANCRHRPGQRTRCALYIQDPQTCTSKVEVRTERGIVCPVCFDDIVWKRSNEEWEIIETPDGDLAKDDWEEVKRVGYDWQEERENNDGKYGKKESGAAAPAVTKSKAFKNKITAGE